MTLAVAAVLLATGAATAQTVDTQADEDYLGDEPNVDEGGTVPYGRGDPSADYPADDNNIAAALEGDATLVLGVKWVNRYCVYSVACRFADESRLVGGLVGRDYIVPGHGQINGWYGTWADANGDGYIRDKLAADRAHVSTRGDCQSTLSTTDANGLGAAQGANTGVSARCSDEDEWVGATPSANGIVVYITPGEYDDSVNRVFGYHGNRAPEPDMTLTGQAVEGENTGRYWGPSAGFDILFVDNSLLETTALEAISSPQRVVNGPRNFEQNPNDATSLVDADLYVSVSSDLEAVYQENVVSVFTAANCQIEYPEDCGEDAVMAGYYGALGTVAPTAGPTWAKFNPAMTTEQNGPDYTAGYHLYLDVVLTVGQNVPLGRTFWNQDDLPNFAPLGDGTPRAFAQETVLAFFGSWYDENGDGWIGSPRETPQCPDDPHWCGMVQDPNCNAVPWTIQTQVGLDTQCYWYEEADAGGEWNGACGPNDSESRVTSSHPATVESSTGSWGETGVYVMTDRRDVTNNNNDPFVSDGRVAFNPYDDLVLDAADGDVNSIVMSGPITVNLQCSSPGFWYSYEKLWFPTGNRGYDVTVSATVTGTFIELGVPLEETISDSDTYAAWPV